MIFVCTICSAQVVTLPSCCSQNPGVLTYPTYEGERPIMTDVACTSYERDLQSCLYTEQRNCSCSYKYAGVFCRSKSNTLLLRLRVKCVTLVSLFFSLSSCSVLLHLRMYLSIVGNFLSVLSSKQIRPVILLHIIHCYILNPVLSFFAAPSS